MCTRMILPDGDLCETIGDLAATIGWDNILLDGGCQPIAEVDRESCLCPADLDAIAERVGWTLDWNSDPFYVKARPAHRQEAIS